MFPIHTSNNRRYVKKSVLKRATSLPEEVSISDLGSSWSYFYLSALSLTNRWASFFLQDTHLVIPFDRNLPDYVQEAMYMVEARLAMGELVRYLD